MQPTFLKSRYIIKKFKSVAYATDFFKVMIYNNDIGLRKTRYFNRLLNINKKK